MTFLGVNRDKFETSNNEHVFRQSAMTKKETLYSH